MGLLSYVDATHRHVGEKMEVDSQMGVNDRAADATITVGAEDTNVRQIAIQLKKEDGSDVDSVQTVDLFVFSSAAMTAFATGGSTGIELGAGGDGAILTVVAKKHFILTSEADGDIDLKWTDTGTESVALAVRLPNGKVVVSAAFANT